MNRTIGIVILATFLLCANSSFIEHIYNNTHLRGGLKLNTTEGLKLGYDGGLHFDNGFLGFEIAKIAGNFNAALRPTQTNGNQTQTTVDYSGDVEVSRGNHSASASVNGTVGITSQFETEETRHGGRVAFNATVTNNNQWTANADNHSAEGTTDGRLDLSTQVERHRNVITIEKHIRGGVENNGTIHNGDKQDNFSIAHFGGAGLGEAIFIKGHPRNTNGSVGGVLPTITYVGRAGGMRGQRIEWNNNSISSQEIGRGKFSGLIWDDRDFNNGTFVHSVKHAKTAEFIHGGTVKVNDELVNVHGGAGVLNSIGSAETKFSNDTKNFKSGLFESGNMQHSGFDVAKPQPEDELLIEKLQNSSSYDLNEIENYEDHSNKSHKVKIYTQTNWIAGKGVEVQNHGNTTDVSTHGGAIWEVDGIVSNNEKKKPIHEAGEISYGSSFEYDKHTSMIKGFLLKFGKDPKAIEELRRKYKALKLAAQ